MSKNQILILLTLFFFSCQKWDLERLDFVRLEITDIYSTSIDSVFISGQVLDFNLGQIKEHGIIWTSQTEPPLIFFNEGKKDFGIKTKNDSSSFSSNLDLEPNTTYLFRAYATLDGEAYIYSESMIFSTGNAEAFTLDINYERGFTLDAYGQLSQTEIGFVALKHGFCWSVNNPQPTLNETFLDLGERRNNEIFKGTIDDLQNDATHYIRAFGVFSFNFKLDTVYGEVLTFEGDLNFWVPRADFPGLLRDGAVGFSIGTKGYMGTGDTDSGSAKDFWEYDPQNDTWTQKADVGGGGRQNGVGFSIDGKGYVGMGEITDNTFIPIQVTPKEDFWEYDPNTNIWTQQNDFAGGAVATRTTFVIGEKGYIMVGYRDNIGFTKEFWEYDPVSDNWLQKGDFVGSERGATIGFSIGGKGYVGTGAGANLQKFDDFWEYDPLADNWTQKTDFPGGLRYGATGFSLNGKGYLGGGQDETFVRKKDFWEYDPTNDEWTRKADLMIPLSNSTAFSIGERAYLGTGREGFDYVSSFWEFDQ